MSTISFVRQARRTGPVPPSGELPLQEPPTVPEKTLAGISSVLMYLPMGLSSLAMVLIFVRPGSGMITYIGAGLMGVSAVGMAFTQVMRSSNDRKTRLHGARRDYLRYLSQMRKQVRGKLAAQQRAARWLHPDPGSLWSLALSSRLWERRPVHEDFGEIRIGLGMQRSALQLVPPETKPVEDLEPLSAHALRRFLRAYSALPNAPIAVYLRGFAQIQLKGDEEQSRGLVRSILAQLVTSHAPGDLRVAVCAGDSARWCWDWVKWLPHAQDPDNRDAAGQVRLVTGNVFELERLLGGDAFAGRPRFEPDTPITNSEPLVVIVLDGVSVPTDHRLDAGGYRNTVVLDVSGALAWQPRQHALLLDIGEHKIGTVSFDRLGKSTTTPLCQADALTVSAASSLARTMARYQIGQTVDTSEPLAADYDLTSLLGIPDLSALDPVAYRSGRTARQRLRVPIGMTNTGRVIELDLKESAEDGMGPHGMLIGATGSGKSELLRTLVLALAATHPSEQLNFVLVDFKGGAAFLGFEQLPHTSAIITNLAEELELVDRMQDALAGEMNRRQEHLRAHNYASRRDYEQARSEGVPLEPMPALFIVVDEFSEMLSSKPEFIDTFAMIGRLGRSLGVHLLLASQRLDEGRIHKVETHLSYRIGLRTFSAMESRSVIGVPDAYELPSSPGNGYLRQDIQTLVRFKAAYASGRYRTNNRQRDRSQIQEQLVSFSTDYLQPKVDVEPEIEEPEPSKEKAVTLLDLMIKRLRGIGPAAHQVWLPPLKQPATLDELLPPLVEHPTLGLRPVGEYQAGALVTPVGMIDLPAQQRRELLTADLAAGKGNVAVVGGPQAGKSTALRTLICGLALTHTAEEVQFYCLDFGGTLASLSGLPHVGSIANRLDRDKVTRTVLELANLLARREKIFADHNIDSMGSYRRARRRGQFKDIDPYGDVFLVVDGWYSIKQDYDELDTHFSELAVRGLGFGIHLVVAANRWSEMRPWLRDVLGTRFELHLGDPIESEVGSRVAAKVPAIPGRGITMDKLHFLTALPRIDGRGATDDLAEATQDLVSAVAVPGAPTAPQVRLLPDVLPVEELPGPTAPEPELDMRVPLGMEELHLGPMWHDFDINPHLMIFGDVESGKTNMLRHLAKAIAAHYPNDKARVVFADFRRELHNTIPQENQLGYSVAADSLATTVQEASGLFQSRIPGPEITPERLRKRDWWKGGRLFFIVDDYELAGGGSSGPLMPLLPMLPQGSDIGLHLIIARSTAGASRAMMDPVIRRMWELGTPAMLFSCPKDEGKFLGDLRPKTLPPGRAQFVNRRRTVRLVQTPLVPGAVEKQE
ncbi:MAG TPA: type VII secretion protein EccCa [Pseudonocardiaceae bacterium]|nr:type VII secretion protein EccCa [Pseudonocardiaceae bacterium]